jgi:Flp pilus assembly protein TadD
MHERAASAFFNDGAHNEKALSICRELNTTQPTVSTLLLQAKLQKRAGKFDEALPLLDQAVKILSSEG